MNVYKRVREYKRHSENFPELERFVGSKSGVLFRDSDNMNSFTNADDMFSDGNIA